MLRHHKAGIVVNRKITLKLKLKQVYIYIYIYIYKFNVLLTVHRDIDVH